MNNYSRIAFGASFVILAFMIWTAASYSQDAWHAAGAAQNNAQQADRTLDQVKLKLKEVQEAADRAYTSTREARDEVNNAQVVIDSSRGKMLEALTDAKVEMIRALTEAQAAVNTARSKDTARIEPLGPGGGRMR